MTTGTYFGIVVQWCRDKIHGFRNWMDSLGVSDCPTEFDPAADPEEDGEGLFQGLRPFREGPAGIFNDF